MKYKNLLLIICLSAFALACKKDKDDCGCDTSAKDLAACEASNACTWESTIGIDEETGEQEVANSCTCKDGKTYQRLTNAKMRVVSNATNIRHYNFSWDKNDLLSVVYVKAENGLDSSPYLISARYMHTVAQADSGLNKVVFFKTDFDYFDFVGFDKSETKNLTGLGLGVNGCMVPIVRDEVFYFISESGAQGYICVRDNGANNAQEDFYVNLEVKYFKAEPLLVGEGNGNLLSTDHEILVSTSDEELNFYDIDTRSQGIGVKSDLAFAIKTDSSGTKLVLLSPDKYSTIIPFAKNDTGTTKYLKPELSFYNLNTTKQIAKTSFNTTSLNSVSLVLNPEPELHKAVPFSAADGKTGYVFVKSITNIGGGNYTVKFDVRYAPF